MRFSSISAGLGALSTDLLVIAITPRDYSENSTKKTKKTILSSIAERFGGGLLRALSQSGFKAEKGASFSTTLQDSQIGAVLFFVVDDQITDPFYSIHQYRALGASIRAHAKKFGATKATLFSNCLKLEKEPLLGALVEGVLLSSYEYKAYRSSAKSDPTLSELNYLSSRSLSKEVIEKATTLCEATIFARDLINMPSNDCTPAFLVGAARQVATKNKLKISVYDEGHLKKLGAGLIVAVGQGSDLPPSLVKLTYTPAKANSKTKVISLVGKGVTYDTGGYSLKPADSMIGMKGDMAGAACVLATMQAIAKLKPNCEVRAYIPIAENMVSGKAARVGDIFTALNGKTVEVLNTDAEGRLILADALSMASRDKAHTIIDIATLTGACVVALGLDYAAVFSNADKLADDIIKFGEIEGERYWKLPLVKEYKDSLTNGIADLKNVPGNRWAGAIIGAIFLQEFVEGAKWAHLDIAGPSDTDKTVDHITKGGVGFGVRTLTRYILAQR